MRSISLGHRTVADIDGQVAKVLRGLGQPEPPIDLRVVRELLKLDRGYYSTTDDSLLRETLSRLKVAGQQVLLRPTILRDAVRSLRSYGGIWVTRRDQAARLWVASDCATPSLNLTPSMTRGNWLVPLSLRHFFEAARIKVKTISLAVFCDNAPLVRTVR